MRAGHCLHEEVKGRQRYCCWCGLTQQPVYEAEPVHGPRYDGQRHAWHWEPPSLGGCPADAAEEAAAG